MANCLQFGSSLGDAFGWTILVETAITCLLLVTSFEYILRLAFLSAMRNQTILKIVPAVVLPILLIGRFVIFFVLVWLGFVSRGKSTRLKVWVFMGLILEMAPQVVYFVGLLIYSIYSDSFPHNKLFFVGILPFLFIFRGYIYFICWRAQNYLLHGDSSSHGYGHGLKNLIFYYGHTKRLVVILLTTMILWNIWTMAALYVVAELEFVRMALDYLQVDYVLLGVIPLRLFRLSCAIFILWFVQAEKMKMLKYLSLPLQVILLTLGNLIPITLLIGCRFRSDCNADMSLAIFFGMETIFNLCLDVLLLYSIFKLINRKYNYPQESE